MAAEEETRRRFESLAMPHLDAAYNLARWLTRNDHDAEDVVHEAFLRAMRYIGSFRGENARPWLLQIVRHTCYSWLKETRHVDEVPLDDESDARHELAAPEADEPPAAAMRKAEREQIDLAIARLPMGYREVLVLRELEDLSYNDIARIVDIPVGTVMSRLSRARALMREALAPTVRPLLRTVARPAVGRSKP